LLQPSQCIDRDATDIVVVDVAVAVGVYIALFLEISIQESCVRGGRRRRRRRRRRRGRDRRRQLTFPNNWIAVSINPAKNSAIRIKLPNNTHAGCNFFCANSTIIRITKNRVKEPTVTA
jgi:hypothetical protein